MQTAAVGSPALQLLRAFVSKPQLAQPGEVLIRAGEPGPNVILLASGWACREHLRSDGDQVLLDLYLPGDIMGLDNLGDEEAFDSITALTIAAYYTLKLKTFELLLLHNPGLRLHIIRKSIEERRRLDEQRLDLARPNAVHKTAARLLRVCERVQKHGINLQCQDGFRFALPLTRQRLADYLGLHPMHLNRILRALRETGIVDVGPHEVNVSSVSRLKEMARLSRSGTNPPVRQVSKKSAKNALAVTSQEVAHWARSEEAEVAEALAIRGGTEWASQECASDTARSSGTGAAGRDRQAGSQRRGKRPGGL